MNVEDKKGVNLLEIHFHAFLAAPTIDDPSGKKLENPEGECKH